jgi:hypothetical protein
MDLKSALAHYRTGPYRTVPSTVPRVPYYRTHSRYGYGTGPSQTVRGSRSLGTVL